VSKILKSKIFKSKINICLKVLKNTQIQLIVSYAIYRKSLNCLGILLKWNFPLSLNILIIMIQVKNFLINVPRISIELLHRI